MTPLVAAMNKYKKEELMKLPILKQDVIDLRAEIEVNSALIDQLKKKLRDLEKTNYELNHKSEREINQLESMSKQYKILQGEKENLAFYVKEEKEKLRSQLKALMEEKKDIAARMEKVEREILDLREVNKVLEIANEKQEKHVAALEIQAREQEAEVKKLKGDLEEKNKGQKTEEEIK